ncbi:CLUMA_CG017184, isoform A [Clunio marinus]|uniref:Phosphatidylinositol-3-phosphatase SAC1 n=1 Tax=Clunio marinus TaxID=568069 RepID=A0A1J1IV69_9DIPT|nr:CLUMA_CG017184, isoform A [Clunio marinus]
MEVHDDMNLYLTTDKLYIEPNGRKEVLVIDRLSQETRVQVKTNEITNAYNVRKICGVLGSIKLISGTHLVIATHRVPVGFINNQVIWRLAGVDLIPYIPSTLHLNENQKHEDETYLAMVRSVLDTPYLYFSYSYDITHTLQRLHSMSPEFLKMSLLERADSRFVWNGNLLKAFQKPELRQYCLPLVMGFISINQVSINGHYFSWILISRRSTKRAGTRLFCRGIDNQGNVSNFVETEQIIEYNGEKVSFVQIRGSIPIFWYQTPNLKLKPRPRIDNTRDHLPPYLLHMDSLIMHYGKLVLVNLIDHRGAEDEMEKAFAQVVSRAGNPNERYEAFDFHAECKKMRWDRLNILIDRLAHEQDEFGVFHLRSGTLASAQDGVFRTNCIDCLDRTNVVQSMLAKRSLQLILTKLGILYSGQTLEGVGGGMIELFKNVWADNADLISVQYSGTGALKTDFTRTGKRTKQGLMKDGMNSLTRYYKNNFNDGFRQDSIDLFLANYVVKDGEGSTIPSPLKRNIKGWKYGTFPTVLLFAVSMFCATVLFSHEYNTESLLFLMFWGAMVFGTGSMILRNGRDFVDMPKLIILTVPREMEP